MTSKQICCPPPMPGKVSSTPSPPAVALGPVKLSCSGDGVIVTHIAAGPAPRQVRHQLEHEVVDGHRVDVGGLDVDVELEAVGQRHDARGDRVADAVAVGVVERVGERAGAVAVGGASPAPASPVQHCVMAQVGRARADGTEVGRHDDGAGRVARSRACAPWRCRLAPAAVAGDADDVRVERAGARDAPSRAWARRSRVRAVVVEAVSRRWSAMPGASCHSASLTVTMIGTEPARKPAPPRVPCVSPAGGVIGCVAPRLNGAGPGVAVAARRQRRAAGDGVERLPAGLGRVAAVAG